MRNLVLALFLLGVLAAAGQKGKKLHITPQTENGNPFGEVVRSLIGNGALLKSYTTNQPANSQAIGSFIDKRKALGVKQGIVIASGSVAKIKGKNNMSGMTTTADGEAFNYAHDGQPVFTKGYFANQGDKDLELTLPGNTTYDACVAELEIIPLGEYLTFNYVFASEEYDEYVGSEFNDAFAFYVTGPGFEGTQNVATIPGTNIPVSINNVNNGNPKRPEFEPQNPDFYIKNDDDVYMQYDGYTRVLTVNLKVTPFKPYHIKMVVADVGDNELDSGVLIEHKSIKSYDKLYDVYFAENRFALAASVRQVLDHIIQQLDENPGYVMHLSGHTDDKGSREYNYELSGKRVEAVQKYLLAKGVPENKMQIMQYGEDKPANTNSTAKGRKDNRRVEVMLLPDDKKYRQQDATAQEEATASLVTTTSKLFQNQPNPVKSSTTFPVYLTDDAEDGRLTIRDAQGRLVQQLYVAEKGYRNITFGTSNLANGIYNVTLESSKGQHNTINMVVQH